MFKNCYSLFPLLSIFHNPVLRLGYFLLVLISSLLSEIASAQNLKMKFDRLNTSNGLSQNTIYTIFQDKKGFLWFGTDDGLNRYDGYNFKIYRNILNDSNSIPDNSITAINEDKSGYLWIGTMNSGLARYDRQSEKFIRYAAGNKSRTLAGKLIYCIYSDNENNLLVGTNVGVNIYERNSDSFRLMEFKEKANPHSVKSIYRDKRGNFWFASANGLFYSDNNLKNPGVYNIALSGISTNNTRVILEDKEGFLWVGTFRGGLNKFDRNLNKFTCYKNNPKDKSSICSNTILALHEDSQGNLLVGTAAGLDVFDRKKGAFIHYNNNYQDLNSFSEDICNVIFEDRAQTLWFGTWDCGLNKFNKFKTKFEHLKNTLSKVIDGNQIIALYEDKDKNFWISTNYGLDRYNPYKDKLFHYNIYEHNNSIKLNNRIASICQDNSGALFFGTNHGLYKYKILGDKVRSVNLPSNLKIFKKKYIQKIHLENDTILWIGTNSEGLFKCEFNSKRIINYKYKSDDAGSISGNKINAIFIDSEGILWAGTASGLNKYNSIDESFTRYLNNERNSNSISNNNISFICEDRNKYLWIGTFGGGLNRYDKNSNSFISYTEKNGLPNNTIKGILIDTINNLWISTNKGLSRFQTANNTFRNYTTSDGLQENEFSQGACVISENGDMHFGGINGLNRFNPANIKDNPHKPDIAITTFRKFNEPVIFDKVISEKESIELSYEDSFFSFEFAALDYVHPEMNQYAYKLEGFDTSWIYNGNRRIANFTNIKGGEYIFKVKGSNSDGVWSENPASIKIFISTPPWETWWARLLYLLSFSGIIFIAVMIHLRNQKVKLEKAREREKFLSESKRMLAEYMKKSTILQEEERLRVSRELHDGVNPVLAEIKRNLNYILQSDNLNEEIQDRMVFLNSSVQNLITDVKSISYDLRPIDLDRYGLLTALKNYFDNFMNSYNIGITFDWELSVKRLRPEIETHIFRILQESLNNIQKHAKASLIEIRFFQENDYFKLTIKDDGTGFIPEAAYLKNSYGLKNMRERTNFFSGNFEIDSNAEKGTTIIITAEYTNIIV